MTYATVTFHVQRNTEEPFDLLAKDVLASFEALITALNDHGIALATPLQITQTEPTHA